MLLNLDDDNNTTTDDDIEAAPIELPHHHSLPRKTCQWVSSVSPPRLYWHMGALVTAVLVLAIVVMVTVSMDFTTTTTTTTVHHQTNVPDTPSPIIPVVQPASSASSSS